VRGKAPDFDSRFGGLKAIGRAARKPLTFSDGRRSNRSRFAFLLHKDAAGALIVDQRLIKHRRRRRRRRLGRRTLAHATRSSYVEK